MELVTSVTFALLAWRVPAPAIVALCWMSAWGVGLAFVDHAVHRLPNRLIATAAVGGLLALAIGSLISQEWSRLWAACLLAFALAAMYLAIAILTRGLGFGDVKLAFMIGLACGWFGLIVTIRSFVITVLVAGVVAAITAARRRNITGSIAFGPSMLIGGLVSILVTAPTM